MKSLLCLLGFHKWKKEQHSDDGVSVEAEGRAKNGRLVPLITVYVTCIRQDCGQQEMWLEGEQCQV